MSKKRRIIAVILVVSMLATLLCGCGTTGDSGRTDDTTGAEQQTVASDQETGSAEDAEEAEDTGEKSDVDSSGYYTNSINGYNNILSGNITTNTDSKNNSNGKSSSSDKAKNDKNTDNKNNSSGKNGKSDKTKKDKDSDNDSADKDRGDSGKNTGGISGTPSDYDDLISSYEKALEQFTNGVAEIQVNDIATENMNNMAKSLQNLQGSIDSLTGELATAFLQKAAISIGVEAVTYTVKYLANMVLEELGFDMRSDEEKILDKLAMLDDIYSTVTNIEEKVNELTLKVNDTPYIDLMEERHKEICSLENATTTKYQSLIEILTEGYEEYVEKEEFFETLLEDGSYIEKDENGEYIYTAEDIEAAGLDKEFFSTYVYMSESVDGETSNEVEVDNKDFEEGTLARYMQYRLCFNYTEVKEIIDEWADQTVNGCDITIEVLNMLQEYSGGYKADGSSYPQIYDYYAYRMFAWEHEGYEFRESAREVDSLIMEESSFMLNMYYSLHGNDSYTKKDRERLQNYINNYNDVLTADPVVRHDDYYICQLIGCQYVFAKEPVYYNYYKGISELEDKSLADSGFASSSISDDVYNRYNNLFHDTNIAYSYRILDETVTVMGVETHLREMYNPIAKVDFNDVDSFATPYNSNLQYIPRSAYQVLYDYYKERYPDKVNNVKDALEVALGMEFADKDCIVCDYADSGLTNLKEISTGFVEDDYNINAFRFCVKHWESDDDYVVVRSCLTDDCDSVTEKRLGREMNINSESATINNMGDVDPYNEFAGLLVLGVPDYVINYDTIK